jgi:DNA mismatch endonuclease (patch repair protein)
MADVFTRAKRSEIMSRVLGRGNRATEAALIAIFRRCHITGWRRHPTLFGNPDFVFRERQLVVFVDGCFWHNCPKHGTRPATNRSFWRKKLERTSARDRLVNLTLRKNSWRVLRIWQHELTKKNELRLAGRLRRLITPFRN